MKAVTTATTGIILDSRHPRKDGTHPLKLRVIFERKARFYTITITLPDKTQLDSLTPDDLAKALSNSTRAIRFKEIGAELRKVVMNADDIIKSLDPFTFDLFKQKFTGKRKATSESDPGNVYFKYLQTIQELEKNNQHGSASNYDLSLKSIKAFVKFAKGKESTRLMFHEITVSWLRRYEMFMIDERGLTRTTVGFYLRALRAVFNSAIEANELESNVYPFGKKKYIIPKGQKVKKALTKDSLKLLMNAVAPNEYQAKARDFWFFSYSCNGMNIKDICYLRNENLEPDSLSFFREKTKRTTDDQHPVIVTLTEYAKSIIEKYRNQDTSPKAFVFPILSGTDTEQEKRKKVQGFTSFINQQIKKLAELVGVTTDISVMFARHSFATLAIQGGASIEFVSEALSHSDKKTTQNYFAGFADITKKDIQEGLMNFDV